MDKIPQSNRKPDFKSNVVIDYLTNQSSIDDLGHKWKISPILIDIWRNEFIDKANQLLTEHKRIVVDAYTSWVKKDKNNFEILLCLSLHLRHLHFLRVNFQKLSQVVCMPYHKIIILLQDQYYYPLLQILYNK